MSWTDDGFGRTPRHVRGASRWHRRPCAAAAARAGRDDEPDVAYGAFQRGLYLTAFREATRRVEREERSQGDDAARRALRRRARRPERRQEGRGMVPARRRARRPRGDVRARHVPPDRTRRPAATATRRAKLLADAAKLGHVVAAYDLALLYLEGQMFPQDFGRAAELIRIGGRGRQPAGAIRARDLLQGRPRRAEGRPARRRGCSAPRRSPGYTDAEVEYGIALFNGTGVAKNEARRRRATS